MSLFYWITCDFDSLSHFFKLIALFKDGFYDFDLFIFILKLVRASNSISNLLIYIRKLYIKVNVEKIVQKHDFGQILLYFID